MGSLEIQFDLGITHQLRRDGNDDSGIFRTLRLMSAPCLILRGLVLLRGESSGGLFVASPEAAAPGPLGRFPHQWQASSLVLRRERGDFG